VVGDFLNVDLAIDEITAHARAACQLDPQVDTIIEIGGQDSKFTTLRKGTVTFSIMNTVCAAGTGSFIEEQAQKLGIMAETIDITPILESFGTYDKRDALIRAIFPDYNAEYKLKITLPSDLLSRDAYNIFTLTIDDGNGTSSVRRRAQ